MLAVLSRELAARGTGTEVFFFEDRGCRDLYEGICPVHFAGQESLSEVISSGRFDIVHTVTYVADAVKAALDVSRFTGPVVVTSHECEAFERALDKAYITAVSQSVADSIQEKYADTVRVIHNGVDTRLFCPGSGRLSEQPIIGWVGRASDPVKDFDALLGVANQLAGKFTPVVVDGSPQDEDNACWLPTNGYVMRRQRLVDMPEYYRTIKGSGGFFFCSSRCEGFGLNILEAMACGCPVVAPSVGGIPELVVHGQSGYLYDRRDGLNGVLEAIDWLYSGDRYERVSHAGLTRAREHFSAKIMSDRYAALYEEVLARSA